MEEIYSYLVSIWHYQLIQFDETWITPAKIITALSIFIIGLFLSNLLSRILVKRMLDGRNLNPGTTTIIQTVLRYAFVVLVCLIALQSSGVPITVFTIFGGALAIGVGFGSQNIVNNFISGLILLIQRPMKKGDLIEIASNSGIVVAIGARSTQLADYRGVTHFIPNSHFLEQNFTNWHYNDDLICGTIGIGIAYGSDTKLAKQILEQAANDDKRIVNEPKPKVLFSDFGNDALNFELLIWTAARSSLERKNIESDMRFTINALFAEHGIVIAFPQRDVHLNATEAIPVHIMNKD